MEFKPRGKFLVDATPSFKKNVESIIESRNSHEELKKFFGGPNGTVDDIPSSVMRADRRTTKGDESVKTRGYQKTNLRNKTKAKVNEEGISPQQIDDLSEDRQAVRNRHLLGAKALEISGKGCGAGALSTFPQNIGKSILLFYSKPGDLVFDPFAGHNSRMDLCVTNGRNYIGCDLSTDFMVHNKTRAEQLREDFPDASITLHHCDSRNVPVEDEVGDFTITSPPYWDIEFYGDEPEQLGKSGTYKEFIEGLAEVMRQNFRVLKPGAFAVWFVNDFRKKGKFHLYHVDVIKIARKAGFIAHDLMISDLGRSIRDCFTNQAVQTKILPKRHEYGLVFRKEG